MAGGLYKLSVQIALTDATRKGFNAIQKNAEAAQKKTEALQKAMQGLEKATGRFDSRSTAREKFVELARREVTLRKQIVDIADAEEKTRIEGELKAIALVKQELRVRQDELGLQDKRLKDSYQDKRRYQRMIEDEEKRNARINLDNQRQLAREAYSAAVEKERRDLASIRMINEYKMRAIRDQERTQTQADRARAAGKAHVSSGLGFLGSMAAGAAGDTILHGMAQGLKNSADMQMALVNVQIATNATAAQMDTLRALAYKLGSQTGQSASEVASEFQTLSSAFAHPADLAKIATPIVNFADVQYFKSGGKASFAESVQQGTSMAHILGAYTPERMAPILEALTRASYAMPDSLARFQTQLSYYAPVFKGLGVADTDTIMAGTIMDRMGLGRGKGGSALQNIILHAMDSVALTSHVQGKQRKGLEALGLVNADGSSKYYAWNPKDKKNEFDIVGLLTQIDKSVKKVPEGLTGKAATKWQAGQLANVNAALGLTGERAALAITPEGLSTLHDSLERIKASGSILDIQARLMNTYTGSVKRFTAGLNSLGSAVTAPWVDTLTHEVNQLADGLNTATAWFLAHPDAAAGFAYDMVAIGGALAAWGLIGLGGIAVNLGRVALGLEALKVSLKDFPTPGTGGIGGSGMPGIPGVTPKGGAPKPSPGIFSRFKSILPAVEEGAEAIGLTAALSFLTPEILGGAAVAGVIGGGIGLAAWLVRHKEDAPSAHSGHAYGPWLDAPLPGNTHVDTRDDHSIQFHGVTINVQGSDGRAQADDFMKQLGRMNVQQALRTGGGQPGPTLARASLLH
jgi:hypothetical protein